MIDPGFAAAGAFTGFGRVGIGGGGSVNLAVVSGAARAHSLATDLWFAAITKVVAARVHQQGGQVDWVVVRRLWWGSLPVAILIVTSLPWGAACRNVV